MAATSGSRKVDIHVLWEDRSYVSPPKIHSDGCLTFSSLVPSTVASWWLQWHDYFPSQFPLPLSLRHFGPVTFNTRGRFIFKHGTWQESDLSKAIDEAWNILPDTIRQLMLFSWAGAQSVRSICNNVAHPDLGTSAAKDILNDDFHNTFENLHATACYMVDYLFDS